MKKWQRWLVVVAEMVLASLDSCPETFAPSVHLLIQTFFLALATGVVESEAGLAVDAGDALDFLLPSGFVALFLDLFLAEELAVDPDGTNPS